MNKEKSPDYFVKRLQDATESMLIALNNYSYEEAVTVLEWIKEKITEDSIVKMQSINISRDKTFHCEYRQNDDWFTRYQSQCSANCRNSL